MYVTLLVREAEFANPRGLTSVAIKHSSSTLLSGSFQCCISESGLDLYTVDIPRGQSIIRDV